MQRFDVIVSGASFAGLAFARALAQASGGDLSVAIIDKAARSAGSTPPDARAFALSVASRSMLGVLGVWDKVDAVAQPVTAIEITDSRLDAGVRPVLVSYDNTLERGEPATYIVPASEVSEALYQSVLADQGTALMAPAAVQSYVCEDHGVVVTLDDGRRMSCSLLIAAEGRKSALRDIAGIKIIGWQYGQTGIITTSAHEAPHEGRAVQHFLPAGPFAILPLTGNRSCITWTEEKAEAQRILSLDDAAFLAEVDRRIGGRLGAITLVGPRQSWPLEMHLARSYVAPRFAVIGDAAHGVHPIAGQGLNLALRDAAALVEVIADAARIGFDVGGAEALARYQRWRRFDSALSAATFDGLNRLFSNDSTLLRAARDAGLGVVDRIPELKKLFVTEAAGRAGQLPRLLRGESV